VSSYPRALAALAKSAPTYTVTVECTSCGDIDDHTEFDLTKVEMVRILRKTGWTFDREGRWRCEHCSRSDARRLEDRFRYVLAVPCPRCGAAVGEPCKERPGLHGIGTRGGSQEPCQPRVEAA